jgi:long-subunit acyl-CoA synthetase (AMP-forming)
MKLTVELDYDARDKMMVDMLTEDYENLYYNYKHDLENYRRNPEKYSYMLEDIHHNEETLDALETLLDYYTPREEHRLIIDRVQNKVTIKRDIARKMGMKSS